MTEPARPGGGADLALELQTRLLELDDVVRRIDATAIGDQPVGRSVEDDDAATADDVARLTGAIDSVHDVVSELSILRSTDLRTVPRWLMPVAADDDPVTSPGGLRLLDERLDRLDGRWVALADRLAETEQCYLLPRIAVMWRQAVESGRAGGRALLEHDSTLAVWVPVVDLRSGNGLLVRLRLERSATPGTEARRVVGGEAHVKPRFRDGVTRGYAAAMTLARRLGVGEEEQRKWQRLEILDVAGARRNERLEDMSAGAPVAAAMVRSMLDVPAGPALVSGEVSATGGVVRLGDEQFSAKSTAAAEHGFTLLRPDDGTDLAALCAQLWGTGWTTARQRCAQRWLDREGCAVREVVSAPAQVTALGGRDLRVVRLPLAERIEKRLRDGAAVVVVGGIRASSRSLSGVQAVTAFAAAEGRRVLEIVFPAGRLPGRSALRATLQHADVAFGVDEGSRTVVLLEDLVPHEGAADIDAVLPSVAAELDCTIVAVCLYTGGNRWSTDQVATVPAVKRHEDVVDFVKRLAAANDMPTMTDGRLGVLRQAADGDLSLLTALLTTGAAADAGMSTVADVRRAWCRQLVDGATPEHLADLRAVAACSLLNVGVPAEMLGDLTWLRCAGGYLDWASRWRLPASVSRGLLALKSPDLFADPGWTGNSRAKYDALAPFLEPRLANRERRTLNLVTALLAGSDVIDQRLNRRLVQLLGTYLASLEQYDRPDAVARVLLASDLDAHPELRTKLLKALLLVVRDRGWEKLTVTEASLALSALRAHRDEVVRLPETERLYTQVMATVADGLGPVVNTAEPLSAALLIHELGRFHEPETNRDIGRLVLLAARRCDETSFVDYEAAVSLFDAAERYHAGDDRATMARRFVDNPGIARLLGHEATAHAGFVLGQAAVRRWVEPVSEVAVEVQARQCAVKVRRLLGVSGLIRAHDGLALLARMDHHFARGVVRNIDGFVPWLREQIRYAAPWEAATMLRLVGGLHIRTAVSVLYGDSTDECDEALIRDLVEQVIAMGDLKGAGHVVSAVASVDRNWGPGGSAAASYHLCTGLQDFVHEAMEHEYRGSVVLATMSALVEADCPEQALRRLLERCADIVAAEVENNDKEHGPRLGHLLATHEQLGHDFVELLAPRIQKRLVVNRIGTTTGVGARTAYHRLARVLRLTDDDEVVEQLADGEWFDRHVAHLAGRPVIEVLESVQAYRETLRDAGHPVVGSEMLAAIDNSVSGWARRLRHLRHPGQLATALDHLRSISAPFAVACLDELENRQLAGGPFRERLWGEPTVSVEAAPVVELPPARSPTPTRLAVQARRRRDLPTPPRRVEGLTRIAGREFVRPAPAIEFVDAVDRIDPGRGGEIGDRLVAKKSWPHRLRLIADIDNPAQLGDVLRKMAMARLTASDDFVRRLDQIWRPLGSQVRSPHAAAAMLTGFVACGPLGADVASQWARALRVDRIGRRITMTGGPGYERLPALGRALLEWGPPGAAERLVEVVTPASYVGGRPGRNDQLLRVVHEVTGAVPTTHLRAAGAALAAALPNSALTADGDSFWRTVGLHCRTLRRLGGGAFVPHDALRTALSREALDPVLGLWVSATAFGGPVADGAFGDALAVVSRERGAVTTALLALAATEVPRQEAVLGEVEVMDVFTHLPIRWQLELLDAAADGGPLAGQVVRQADWLADYGERLLDVGRSAGRVVLRSLATVEARDAGRVPGR